MKTGLVLEGGGMRGLYTIGVLDYFASYNIKFDYIIGVSAGACSGTSYVSEQPGRNYRVNTEYLSDKRYLSVSNFIKTGSLFGMDFIFDEIPNKIDLFDFDTFLKSDCEFVTGVTDVKTGKPVYFGKDVYENNDTTILRASSSIPVFSPPVKFRDGIYLDGGTSDPIPIRKAISDGCDKIIVVLTRDRNYIKSKESFRPIYKTILRKYPEMIKTLDIRDSVYNETRKFLFELEKQKKIIVLAPSVPPVADRFEKSIDKLNVIYELGKSDAADKIDEIIEYIK